MVLDIDFQGPNQKNILLFIMGLAAAPRIRNQGEGIKRQPISHHNLSDRTGYQLILNLINSTGIEEWLKKHM